MSMHAYLDDDELAAEIATDLEWATFCTWGRSIEPYLKYSEIDYLCTYRHSDRLGELEAQLLNALEIAIDGKVRTVAHKLLDVLGDRFNDFSTLLVASETEPV